MGNPQLLIVILMTIAITFPDVIYSCIKDTDCSTVYPSQGKCVKRLGAKEKTCVCSCSIQDIQSGICDNPNGVTAEDALSLQDRHNDWFGFKSTNDSTTYAFPKPLGFTGTTCSEPLPQSVHSCSKQKKQFGDGYFGSCRAEVDASGQRNGKDRTTEKRGGKCHILYEWGKKFASQKTRICHRK